MKEVPPCSRQEFYSAGNNENRSAARIIVLQVTGLRLAVCLVVILLTGIGIGLVAAGRFAPLGASEILRVQANDISPQTLSAGFAAATRAVEPSVVHITTVDLDSEGEVFNQSSGSGVIIDPAGYIITNYHVVKGANRIKVRLGDGSLLSGTVIGLDEESDLAVVQVVTNKPLKAAHVGNSDKLTVGDWVLAIGSPFGLEQTVTAGIISAKERVTDNSRNFNQFLQTDAAINPGNSGGPLINMNGEVIGINTQIATRTGNFQGVGFAVPSVIFTDVYNQLVTNGRVSRGYLGVAPDKVTPQFAQIYNLQEAAGALIHDLTGIDGPAAKAGLKSGDVIVEFDGYKIKDDRDLVRRIVSTRVNTPVIVKYVRNGQVLAANVNLIERAQTVSALVPRSTPEIKPQSIKDNKDNKIDQKLGLSITTLTEMRAQQMGYKATAGVVVRTVETSSVAYDAGLKDGDVIKEVNKQPVSKQEDFAQLINKLKPGDSLVFFVEHHSRRGSSHKFISLTVP
ncbi:MAG: trypsin-like peptidase domain-containing protein [Acidobacteriota bacterium]